LTTLNRNSTVEKIIRISSYYEGSSIIEVPSFLSVHRVDVFSDLNTLTAVAKELHSLGVIHIIEKDDGLQSFLNTCMKLNVIIQHLELSPGEELSFTVGLTPRDALGDKPEELDLLFTLNVSQDYELPHLLPQLIVELTGFLMMFNHRMVDSSRALN
jgi:hypothetical protein